MAGRLWGRVGPVVKGACLVFVWLLFSFGACRAQSAPQGVEKPQEEQQGGPGIDGQDPDEEQPEPFFQPIAWDYPFVLNGFDKDVLACVSISARFEKDKIILSCQEPSPPKARVKQRQPLTPPPFDAAAFVQRRYGAPKGSTGPVITPFVRSSWMSKAKYSFDSNYPYAPAERFQYAVPSFSQTYYQNGQWHALLLVNMYYEVKSPKELDERTPSNRNCYGMTYSGTTSFSFKHERGKWRLLREGPFPYLSMQGSCKYTGLAVRRIWKLPDGQHAFLDIVQNRFVSHDDASFCVASAYLLQNDGSAKRLFDLHLAFHETQFLHIGAGWERLSTLQVEARGPDLIFTQQHHSEVQREDAPRWTSDTHRSTLRLHKGKVKGSFFSPIAR